MLPLYPELDSSPSSPRIRLIELDLADDSADVSCNFHVKDIQEASYLALSYTWGEDLASYRISLNGHAFLVRQNLYQALCAIRKRLRESLTIAQTPRRRLDVLKSLGWNGRKQDPCSKYGKYGSPYFDEQLKLHQGTVYLWIDAISINQQNFAERSEQVQLMAQIYSSAKVVLAWLGEYNDTTRLQTTIACLENTNNAIAKKKNSISWSRPTREEQKLMENIAGNPYWTRLWIVQELMLAQRVLIQISSVIFEYEELLPLFLKGPGGVTVNWTFSYRTFGSSWRIEDTSMGELLWLKTTLQDHEKDKVKVTVPMLLTLTQKQQCSDRRDKVFGLLGLVDGEFIDPTKEATISTDYSLSTVEVYAMVLRHATTQQFGSSTSIIHLCWKAANALAVTKNDPLFVSSTAEFLSATIGPTAPAWGRWSGDQVTIEDIKSKVASCRWTSTSLDDVVADIVSGVSGQLRTFVTSSPDKVLGDFMLQGL